MNAIIICGILSIAIFYVVFTSKRRFGSLGLALAAGSILSGLWSYDAGFIVSGLGIPDSSFNSVIIISIITLLPAGLLLFHGSVYKTLIGRLLGAGLFTLLVASFLIKPIGPLLVLQGSAATIYNLLVDNRSLTIGVCLIVAIVDIFLTKTELSA